jgi:hypothetical protein
MEYVLWTLGVEVILFVIYIFYRAHKEIKEEEKDRFIFPSDFFN